MPRHFGGYEPDQVDCQTLSLALSSDFGMLPEITTRYGADEVTVICKCRHLGALDPEDVIVQAKDSIPLKQHKSLYVMHYTVMLDCWHQLDRGVLAAAARPIVRGWDGRPQQPRRRT